MQPLTVFMHLYLDTQQQLQMQNGALFAVPIPEEFEAAGAVIQKFVDQAVAESEANGISKRGNDVTPWLLNRIGELSEGKSLTSNIALLENSALVGGYQILSSQFDFLTFVGYRRTDCCGISEAS